MKPVKHTIGRWLLLSLIPATVLFFLGLMVSVISTDTGGTISAIAFFYMMPVGPSGLVLLIWGNIEFHRSHRTAQQYAELHGWRAISSTAWRNRKRNNIDLSVSQAFKKRTFILTIEMNGETVSIDEFETSIWALQFGDWLWEELMLASTVPTTEVVAEKRAEWNRSQAMTLYEPGNVQRR